MSTFTSQAACSLAEIWHLTIEIAVAYLKLVYLFSLHNVEFKVGAAASASNSFLCSDSGIVVEVVH